jgi:hypothetical protein
MASSALTHLRNQVDRFKNSSKLARAKAGEVTEQILSIGEVAGTAFAFGYFDGKTVPGSKVFNPLGIPAPLLGGVLAHAAALLGVGRGMESHLKNIGNGALSAHLFHIGQEAGTKARTAAPATKGDVDLLGAANRSGAAVTESDLANMAF